MWLNEVSLFGKGQKVNAGKSKVMVDSSDERIIVNPGKWPCGVCEKGLQTNCVHCTSGAVVSETAGLMEVRIDPC